MICMNVLWILSQQKRNLLFQGIISQWLIYNLEGSILTKKKISENCKWLWYCQTKVLFVAAGMTPSGMTTPGHSTPGHTPSHTPGGFTPGGLTPGGFTPSGVTPTGTKAMNMATPTPGHLMSMTPEQLQAYTWQREIDERNRPLSDEELEAMFPPGYKVHFNFFSFKSLNCIN